MEFPTHAAGFLAGDQLFGFSPPVLSSVQLLTHSASPKLNGNQASHFHPEVERQQRQGVIHPQMGLALGKVGFLGFRITKNKGIIRDS